MSQISTCPRCRLQVSLPAKASPAAQVKCPLCSAEYALQDALNEMPPMLIVLDPGPVEAAVMSEAAVGAELDAASTGMLPEVEFPDDAAAGGLPHFADDADVADDRDFADGVDDAEGRLSLGDEAPDESGAMIGGALRDQTDESGDGAFDLGRGRDGASRPAAAGRRGQRSSSGGFGEMVKAVMGGVIGLAIGYYILLWLGKDPMLIKPFLHSYLPDWLVP